jgi:hypothetical protein
LGSGGAAAALLLLPLAAAKLVRGAKERRGVRGASAEAVVPADAGANEERPAGRRSSEPGPALLGLVMADLAASGATRREAGGVLGEPAAVGRPERGGEMGPVAEGVP